MISEEVTERVLVGLRREKASKHKRWLAIANQLELGSENRKRVEKRIEYGMNFSHINKHSYDFRNNFLECFVKSLDKDEYLETSLESIFWT